MQEAVFGNVGTSGSLQLAAEDARTLREEFAPTFTERDLVELSKFDFYLRLMIDGAASKPFSATGLPPADTHEGQEAKVVRVSRQRYACASAAV